MGAPNRCAIFSAKAVDPVPENILTEGFMRWLNVGQSYHSVYHLRNINMATFQQVIHLVKNSIFFLVFIPLCQVII
jgi:hypothetical protein